MGWLTWKQGDTLCPGKTTQDFSSGAFDLVDFSRGIYTFGQIAS